ncbi:MAG: hypothetical protein KC493_07185 [Bacteriovoracaceae bacterium]|nr:hypothetical protein [Bacteriovoracaceae bacterium]
MKTMILLCAFMLTFSAHAGNESKAKKLQEVISKIVHNYSTTPFINEFNDFMARPSATDACTLEIQQISQMPNEPAYVGVSRVNFRDLDLSKLEIQAYGDPEWDKNGALVLYHFNQNDPVLMSVYTMRDVNDRYWNETNYTFVGSRYNDQGFFKVRADGKKLYKSMKKLIKVCDKL